jgi:alpha-N-acetylglucosaminidase
LADLTRQVLSDAATVCYGKLIAARQRKDKARVAQLSQIMLGMFDDVDDIVATRREFLLGAWIHDARGWGATPAEADLCEHSARALLTIWSEPGAAALADYANRTWAGLVKDYYKHRWEMWLNAVNSDALLNEAAVRESIRQWEFRWVKQTAPTFSANPSGDTVAVAKALCTK